MKGAAWHPQKRSPFRLDRAFSLRHLGFSLDWHVLVLALLLLCLGLFFVQGMASADRDYYRPGVGFASHLKKVAVTLPALALALLVRPRWLRRNAWLLYLASIVLLLLVPVLGEERNNARRWIPLPGIGFDLQPSELAKLGLIVALAAALYRSRLKRWSEWVRPAILALIPMALVFEQPDLGTAMTIVPVTLGMLYLAGASWTRIAGIVLAGVLAAFLAYQLELVRDYQLQRIDTWLATVDKDQLIAGRNGPAFHTYHARVAIGNGGLEGRGRGKGVANEAGHLPERDSDSIFAVIAEEAGWFLTTGMVLLYVLLIVLLMIGASAIRERFTRLVVGGIALYFAAHFFINVGVNLGLLPMTGLTLPLFSTGGSSLLASFLALGLALGLSAQWEPTLDVDAFRD
jgi:rod shape determining protein RodA